MSRNNRTLAIIVILAVAVVAIVDRNVVLSLFGQVLYIVQIVFFITATLWLLKHY